MPVFHKNGKHNPQVLGHLPSGNQIWRTGKWTIGIGYFPIKTSFLVNFPACHICLPEATFYFHILSQALTQWWFGYTIWNEEFWLWIVTRKCWNSGTMERWDNDGRYPLVICYSLLWKIAHSKVRVFFPLKMQTNADQFLGGMNINSSLWLF